MTAEELVDKWLLLLWKCERTVMFAYAHICGGGGYQGIVIGGSYVFFPPHGESSKRRWLLINSVVWRENALEALRCKM